MKMKIAEKKEEKGDENDLERGLQGKWLLDIGVEK